ncbi:MAG: dTMP kinase [Pirellulales bacterium]|nr:dTMP kinase [Pirellulales bacterium]
MFFAFDGLDGVGKSTQIQQFCQWLSEQGHTVATCRDPGSTPLGEAIRDLLLHRAELTIDRPAEMFLYMAARAQLVQSVIQPALARGEIVVSDRYLLANVVYQGYAGGLDVELLWQIGKTATAGLLPDLTFVLDLSPAAAAARLNRPLDRMEQQGADFATKLRAGFLAEALRQPDRIAVVDADRPVEEIQQEIRQIAAEVLDLDRG